MKKEKPALKAASRPVKRALRAAPSGLLQSPKAGRREAKPDVFDIRDFCHDVLDSIVCGVWATDRDHKGIYANKGLLAFSGATEDNFIGVNILKDIPKKTMKYFLPYYHRARKTLKPVFYDAITVANPSGRQRIQSGWLFPVVKGGRFDGMVGTVNDITDRNRSETTLEREKEKAQKYLDIAGVMFVALDAQGRITLINKKGCQILGYTEEELLGRSWFDVIIPAEIRADVRNVFHKIMGSKYPHESVYQNLVLTKSGRKRLILWHNTFLTDEQGLAIGTLSSGEDITLEKQAEDELRESEEKYRQLFELESDAIFLIENETGRIIEANPTASALYGFSHDEFLARTNTDLSAEPDKTRMVTTNRETWVPVRWHRKKDDTVFPVEITGRHFIWQGRNVHIASIRDISKRMEAEEIVLANLREKEVLLKEIHHRVKNNMQIISSLLNLQSRRIQNPDVVKIFRESQSRIRSIALAHEKLYMSRDLSHIDFGDYVQGLAVHLFQINQANTDLIKLKVELENVYFDIQTAIPCGLILNELITNSLKHAFAPGEGGEIIVELHRLSEGAYRMTVRDNGIGLPEAIDITDPPTFGFQIVSMLVNQLEGTIQVDRAGGTSFVILFKESRYRARL